MPITKEQLPISGFDLHATTLNVKQYDSYVLRNLPPLGGAIFCYVSINKIDENGILANQTLRQEVMDEPVRREQQSEVRYIYGSLNRAVLSGFQASMNRKGYGSDYNASARFSLLSAYYKKDSNVSFDDVLHLGHRLILNSSLPQTNNYDVIRKKSACKVVDTEVFYPLSDVEASKAKSLCRECEVRDLCLEYAIQTRQDHGVWGGATARERRVIIRKRRRENLSNSK